jgi:hypothetical protein
MSQHNTELCLTDSYALRSYIEESQTIRVFDTEQYILPHIDPQSDRAGPYEEMRKGRWHYIVANNNQGRTPR